MPPRKRKPTQLALTGIGVSPYPSRDTRTKEPCVVCGEPTYLLWKLREDPDRTPAAQRIRACSLEHADQWYEHVFPYGHQPF